jgi:hypothetical protein
MNYSHVNFNLRVFYESSRMSSEILNSIYKTSSFSVDETAILKHSHTEFVSGSALCQHNVSMGQYELCKALDDHLDSKGAARESDINVQDLSARVCPVMMNMGKYTLQSRYPQFQQHRPRQLFQSHLHDIYRPHQLPAPTYQTHCWAR